MSNKDLRLSPHNSKNWLWWWYEAPRGIEIYFSQPGIGYIRSHIITWKAIRKALERKDKK